MIAALQCVRIAGTNGDLFTAIGVRECGARSAGSCGGCNSGMSCRSAAATYLPPAMDGISAWFHQTLDVDPSVSATLLRFFVVEQGRLRTGRERITRVLATIGGVMDQESLGRALSVLANVPKAQLLVQWSNVVASTHSAVAST